MSLPYPQPIAGLLGLEGGTNFSLLWDRGVDMNALSNGGRSDFLARFRTAFEREPAGFKAFVERRHQALTGIGAKRSIKTSSTRLVIGLGLPHSLETGFLFDGVTGCPYLPGSSVKGLLRAAARLTASGDLEGDQGFWSRRLDEIFGPETAGGPGAAKGKAAFYDAFPQRWPSLEIDVLTPHYKAYYENGSPPGDWEDPVPVPFLTIAAKTPFGFHFRISKSIEAAPAQMERLLSTVLDWLGIGGKKAAGHGIFKPEESPNSARAQTLRSTRVR